MTERPRCHRTCFPEAARLAGTSLLRLQSDERLVALIRDGHDPAFAAVVDRYRPELLRACTRLVGEARAEDVVQQALLNAHMALHSNDSPVQLRPWLHRIAHNAGLNVLRSSRAQSELDEHLAAPGNVEHDLETRERLSAALAAIALLPEPQRDALTLRALEGRSHEEIATALGVTAGAARQHLHRARVSVRAAVSAVTPYGLMARLAMAGGESVGTPLAAGAGAGLGVSAVKVGAGLLAAGSDRRRRDAPPGAPPPPPRLASGGANPDPSESARSHDAVSRLKLAQALQRAKYAIAWERSWPHLARLLTIIGLFLVVSWAGVWLALPFVARAAGLSLFILAALGAIFPLIRFRWPSRKRA